MALLFGIRIGGWSAPVASGPLVGALLLLVALVTACVKTTRRVIPTTEAILSRHDIQVTLAPGWQLMESPMHFRDTSDLRMTSPDGMVVFLEVIRDTVPDLDKRVLEVRERYHQRYQGGRFHPVQATIGVYPAKGFDGTVVRPGESGRRINVFFRCFNASGRHVSIQGQALAAVWSIRRADLKAILASIRIGPGPQARKGREQEAATRPQGPRVPPKR